MDDSKRKGLIMKIAGLLSMLMVALGLVGCENSELITCQQQKQVLETRTDDLKKQLDQAKSAITERDKQIEALQTENVEIQNKAMESITTMMQKQAAADEKVKKQLADTKEELTEVKSKLSEQKTEHENLKVLYENALQSLDSLQKEKQALMDKLDKIQKTAAAPREAAIDTAEAVE